MYTIYDENRIYYNFFFLNSKEYTVFFNASQPRLLNNSNIGSCCVISIYFDLIRIAENTF